VLKSVGGETRHSYQDTARFHRCGSLVRSCVPTIRLSVSIRC